MLSAAFVTVALVLGEFTIASLLELPAERCRYVIALLGKSDATISVAASLAALLFASSCSCCCSRCVGRRAVREGGLT